MNPLQKINPCLIKNFFYTTNSLTDYNIPGTLFKGKVIQLWRNTFVDNNNIFEVDHSSIIPSQILESTGHINNLCEPVVYDDSGICHNAHNFVKDWLINNKLETLAMRVDTMNLKMLETHIKKYKMVKKTDNIISKKRLVVNVTSNTYLPYELSFGIFANINSHVNFIGQIMNPFGLATTGKVYSFTKDKLDSVKESNQGSIFYFFDPLNNEPISSLHSYSERIFVLTKDVQSRGKNDMILLTAEAIIKKKLMNNTYLIFILESIRFIHKLGINEEKIRIRQLVQKELYHYATDSWALELIYGGGWYPVVEFINRGNYDLQVYNVSTGEMNFKRKLPKPVIETFYKPQFNMEELNERYPQQSLQVINHFQKLSQPELIDMKSSLDKNGGTIYLCFESNICILSNSMVAIEKKEHKILYEDYLPHVLESRFYFDHLICLCLSHNYHKGEDTSKLILPKNLIPYPVGIVYDSQLISVKKMIKGLEEKLKELNLAFYTNSGKGNVNMKCSQFNEMGTLITCVIDQNSVKSKLIELRMINGEIDTVPIKEFVKKVLEYYQDK